MAEKECILTETYSEKLVKGFFGTHKEKVVHQEIMEIDAPMIDSKDYQTLVIGDFVKRTVNGEDKIWLTPECAVLNGGSFEIGVINWDQDRHDSTDSMWMRCRIGDSLYSGKYYIARGAFQQVNVLTDIECVRFEVVDHKRITHVLLDSYKDRVILYPIMTYLIRKQGKHLLNVKLDHKLVHEALSKLRPMVDPEIEVIF